MGAESSRDVEEQERRRRADWIRVSDPVRRQMLCAWGAASDPQRDTIANASHLAREQITSLLDDPAEFAARCGAFIELTYALGLVRRPCSEDQTKIASFTQSEIDGLKDAIDAYDWEAPDVVAAVEAVSGLIAEGGDRRLGLGTAKGWRRAVEDHDVRKRGQNS